MDIKIAVTGFGNVGQGLAQLLADHGETYERRYGLRLILTGVADRGGTAIDPMGLNLHGLLESKRKHGTIASGESRTQSGNARQFLTDSAATVFVEAASTNFTDAEPGLSYIYEALEQNIDVVLASKGALALDFRGIVDFARKRNRRVLFSATVAAPTPILEIADRALVGSEILAFEGILNATTHQILTAMASGATYDDGVRQAQETGIAETDPTLDVDGWDAAAKVAIVANAVLGSNLTISDVKRSGIRNVSSGEIRAAAERGEALKLVGRATKRGHSVEAEVKVESRARSDALGRLQGDDMGIIFTTEPLGKIAATVESAGRGGGIVTAMTVLRDIFNLAHDRGWSSPPTK